MMSGSKNILPTATNTTVDHQEAWMCPVSLIFSRSLWPQEIHDTPSFWAMVTAKRTKESTMLHHMAQISWRKKT